MRARRGRSEKIPGSPIGAPEHILKKVKHEIRRFAEERPLAKPDQRTDYARFRLTEADVDPDPFRQFDVWFDAAVKSHVPEPNAMTLATATPEGKPSARIVLLRGVDSRGLTFFTNYDSRKSRELAANPQGALVFFWQALERQVRVEGTVERVSAAESDEYFHSRPELSRIGAWASPQSAVIDSREDLEARIAEWQTHFASQPLSRPENWGGFRLVPTSFEFWQGRPSRLHDRLRFTRAYNETWLIERLAP